MTLEGLLYAIGQIGINDKLINFAAAGGSIYEINDLTIRDYPILYVSPTGTHRMSENYTTYQVTIFFIDRLLEDNSNGVAIHSTAVEVLKNIIKKIAVLEDVAGISDEYTIQLFTETEKMKDRCNGAYATIEIMLLNESTCIMPDEGEPTESGDTPTENWYLYFNNPDGETIPAESTAYTVEWRTNIPDIPYIIYGPEGVIESGSTDGEIRKEVDFAENESTATTREYTFMFLKDNGDNLSGLTWYQDVKAVEPGPEPPQPEPEPDYYFNFTVPDNQVIPADATGFTVSWKTNYPEVEYTFVTPDGAMGGTVGSGITAITLNFPANENVSTQKEYMFIATQGSDTLGNLTWKQDNAIGYFRFVTPNGMSVSSAATSFHVDWDTNYPMIQYKLTGDENEFIATGATTGSGYTFTFPASESDAPTQYELVAYNPFTLAQMGVLYWQQEYNVNIPHNYERDYLTFNILSGGTIIWKNGTHQPNPVAHSISYSKNSGNTWVTVTSSAEGAEINVSVGDRVLFKGEDIYYHTALFAASSSLKFNLEGNIMSLLYGDNYWKKYTLRRGGLSFDALFYNNNGLVDAHNLILPAVEIGAADYSEMFYGCASMLAAPQIKATKMGIGSCTKMFWGCVSLTQSPALNAPILNNLCYKDMFHGCSNLNKVVCTATNISAYKPTEEWLNGVSPTGTFIKKAGVDWTTGESGIPDGWTVQEI